MIDAVEYGAINVEANYDDGMKLDVCGKEVNDSVSSFVP